MIFIASLSLVGYVLTRWLGPGRGAMITGLAGGFVSSTAVALSFAREGRAHPKLAKVLACGILVSWAAMIARVVVEVTVVNRALLGHLLVPLLAMGAVVGGLAAFLYLRSDTPPQRTTTKGEVKVTNPFSLTAAVKFAAFFAVVLLAVKIAQDNFSPAGVYALSLIHI